MEQKVVLALRKRQAELKAKGEASMNFTRIILKFGTIRSVLREIRAVFEQFDQDKSGAIDHTELGTMMRQLNVQMGEEDIGNLFRLADFNGANQLTLKQLLVCICIGYVLGVIPDLTTATDPKAEATAAGAAAAGAKAGGGSSATAVAAAAGVNVAGAGASSTASVVGSTGETAAATAGAAGSSEAEALAAAAGRGRRGTFQGRESNIRLAMDLIVCAYLMFDPGCRGHIRKEDVLNIISETGGGEKAVSGGGGGGGSGAVQPRCSAGGGNGGTHHLRGSANGGGASGGGASGGGASGGPSEAAKRKGSGSVSGGGGVGAGDKMEKGADREKSGGRGGSGSGGSSLLSEDRWQEMDWDSNGDISFEEFVYAFTKWVDIDDDEL